MTRRSAPSRDDAERVFGTEDASLLDIVDNLLNKGVVLTGDITLGLAKVELIYARVSLLLSAADRVLPHDDDAAPVRRPRGGRLAAPSRRRA